MTDASTRTIPVYVRLCGGDEDCREISFNIPEDIPQSEILEHGYAVDGREAVRTVVTVKDKYNHVPVTKALHGAQLALIEWLDMYGYEVEFK